jgi:N,N'-diacetyllegionaminate synthase
MTTIIAELATAHGGNVGLACDMVKAAADAGATYAKLQTYDIEKLSKTDPQRDWLIQAHLSEGAHEIIFGACHRAGIKPLSTPFDADSLAMLRRLGLREFKIASSESANDWWDPQEGEQWFVSLPWGRPRGFGAKNKHVTAYLTAIPLYPTPLEAVGRADLVGKPERGGWSDHCVGLAACQRAIALGVEVIEAHLRLEGRGRQCVWDKTPAQFRELREFADDVATMTSGVATRFRRRWTA